MVSVQSRRNSTSPSLREPKHGQASKGQYQSVPVDHANSMNLSETPVSEGGTEPGVFRC